MLMKTPYLTAKELELTEKQHQALVITVDFLRSIKIKATDVDGNYKIGDNIWFGMRDWCDVRGPGCGTVMCIGGTAEWLIGEKCFDKENYPYNLWHLFYCGRDGSDNNSAWDATPAQAADALEHYLRTGKEEWGLFV